MVQRTHREAGSGRTRLPSTAVSPLSQTTHRDAADPKATSQLQVQKNADIKTNNADRTTTGTRRRSAPCLSDSNLSSLVPTRTAFESRRSDPGIVRPAIFDKYKPVKWIGKGQFGTVFAVETRNKDDGVVVDDASPGKSAHQKHNAGRDNVQYACKIIDIATSKKREEGKELLEDVLKEIVAMKGSTHPNVQDLVDFSVEADKVYIVSSLCRGGDLAQALQLRGCLCEEDARTVMAGVLRGVSYLHSKGVMHRDIKLENILLANCRHDMSKVKIIDMGFAKKLSGPGATTGAEAINTVSGTPLYFAPELVKPSLRAGAIRDTARYGTKADMWSCGIVLCCLLSGCPPFPSTENFHSILELYEDISNADFDFSDPVWELVSDEAMSMVKSLLEADPSKRMSADEALRHPWMAGC